MQKFNPRPHSVSETFMLKVIVQRGNWSKKSDKREVLGFMEHWSHLSMPYYSRIMNRKMQKDAPGRPWNRLGFLMKNHLGRLNIWLVVTPINNSQWINAQWVAGECIQADTSTKLTLAVSFHWHESFTKTAASLSSGENLKRLMASNTLTTASFHMRLLCSSF